MRGRPPAPPLTSPAPELAPRNWQTNETHRFLRKAGHRNADSRALPEKSPRSTALDRPYTLSKPLDASAALIDHRMPACGEGRHLRQSLPARPGDPITSVVQVVHVENGCSAVSGSRKGFGAKCFVFLLFSPPSRPIQNSDQARKISRPTTYGSLDRSPCSRRVQKRIPARGP